MTQLLIENLNKTFDMGHGKAVTALSDISLTVDGNEFAVLVGPSGCGKSTLLNIVAGLDTGDPGSRVLLDGAPISGPGADRGMVFQSYTLFPWLSVRKNIAFGLQLQNRSKAEIDEIVEHYMRVTGLSAFADAYPKNLSGGMKQRVAIARTLANRPKLVLMDEPFGALDAQTRVVMQELLADIWRKERSTVLFVTHDIDEAILMGTKIFVMSRRPGRIRTVLPVDLPGERSHKSLMLPEFLAIKSRIMELIWEESREAAIEGAND